MGSDDESTGLDTFPSASSDSSDIGMPPSAFESNATSRSRAPPRRANLNRIVGNLRKQLRMSQTKLKASQNKVKTVRKDFQLKLKINEKQKQMRDDVTKLLRIKIKGLENKLKASGLKSSVNNSKIGERMRKLKDRENKLKASELKHHKIKSEFGKRLREVTDRENQLKATQAGKIRKRLHDLRKTLKD